MRVKVLFILSVMAITLVPVRVFASAGDIVISEISMGSEESASSEFVELYNNSSAAIDISNWGVYYKSATGKTWTKRASIGASTTLAPHSFYLISTDTGSSAHLTSGMAQSGGTIQVRNTSTGIVDQIGWGSTDTSNGKASIVVQAGESLYRQYDQNTLTMVDTGDNFGDFYITTNMTPAGLPVAEAEEPETKSSYPHIVINELYPDPTADQSESSDEFIELYNPNSYDVDLNGWLLKDASENTYIIKAKTISAGGYISIMSAESHLSLNNTGDTIRLMSPSSQLIDETADYGESIEGLSWALVGDTWNWTVSPTPNTTNSAVYVINVAKAAGASTASAKKVAVKKASTAKPKAAKANKIAGAKVASANGGKTDTDNTSSAQSALANLWPWLLITLGIGTIGYGIYEYRPEITTAYYKLKNKFSASN